MIRSWDELPDYMRTDEVRPYYELLRSKSPSLAAKLIFDKLFSILLLLILSPIFLIIAIAVRLDSKGPIIYKQQRITQYGRAFSIFKFRTMVVNADQIGALVTSGNDPRITRSGAILRKYRLDEIPQLVNILKGDMSFVGTRPEVKRYVDRYEDEWYATLLLPAGVTSRASILFKDEDAIISKATAAGKSVDEAYIKEVLPQKMKYNLLALKEFSILSELKTMIDTVIEVL